MTRSTPSTADLFPARYLARWLLALAAAVGLAICLVLTGMSLPSSGGEGGVVSSARLCAPGERVNCDYVLASPWGRIGPLPTAVTGVAYFAALAAWFAFAGLPNRAGRLWHAVPLTLTSVGMAWSALFMYVMAAELPVWCTWCVAAHGVNLLLFAGVLLTWPRARVPRAHVPLLQAVPRDGALPAEPGASERPPLLEAVAREPPVAEPAQPSSARAAAVLASCAAVMLVVLLTGAGLVHQLNSRRFQLLWLEATNDIEYIRWRHGTAPRHDIPIRADDVTMGEADAPHVLVVFSDFECDACREFHRNAAALTSQFPAALRIVFRHFPMDAACNPAVEGRFHAFACDAAVAAAAACEAGTPDQARRYAWLLFENADRLAGRPYARLAREAGIDIAAFEAAMTGEAAAARVRQDVELARSLGARGTPAMYLDGRLLPAWRIVTTDVHPRGNPLASLELWERLLETPAKNKPGSGS